MKLNTETFMNKKYAILDKLSQHFANPSLYPMPKLSLDECAILMAKDEFSQKSKMAICKIEHTALNKLRAGFKRHGVLNMSDAVLKNY